MSGPFNFFQYNAKIQNVSKRVYWTFQDITCLILEIIADDQTSNDLKRPVKNVRSRFGSLLYIEFIELK